LAPALVNGVIDGGVDGRAGRSVGRVRLTHGFGGVCGEPRRRLVRGFDGCVQRMDIQGNPDRSGLLALRRGTVARMCCVRTDARHARAAGAGGVRPGRACVPHEHKRATLPERRRRSEGTPRAPRSPHPSSMLFARARAQAKHEALPPTCVDAAYPPSSFGERHGAASRAARSSPSASIATRSWARESRSRTVTVWSSSVWWSIVTQYGVPISSWRR